MGWFTPRDGGELLLSLCVGIDFTGAQGTRWFWEF